ncbi:MAG TPA: long-chain fatty acid--CoA ligase [Gemmatimonadales bacterium]|nr:long-chain fatty acid--CoA ligase [Gemmatimonadales bacterium]
MADPRTLNELFLTAIDQFGARPVAMRRKTGGRWVDLSYAELRNRVLDASLGFRELGLGAGDRIAILSENRPEWAIVDFATLLMRAANVPIYPTLPPKQIEYILRDSGSAAICLSSAAQLAKVREIRAGLPGLKSVVAFDDDATGPGVLSLAELEAKGRLARPRYPEWRDEALAVRADDLATIIYTSGTTGEPKGVMLTHGNIASNVVTCSAVLPFGPEDEALSFLPLSHIFERMVGHYSMFGEGVLINYASSHDSVAAEMAEVRPTIMAAVPRFYEKLYARVVDSAMTGSRVKRRIFLWARKAGETWADWVLAGRPVPATLLLRKQIADRLVFSKLQARTGGRVRFFVSGGAPLNPDIARFFHAASLPILEGYGLTETSPVIAVNTFEHTKLGTVGRPIPGVEVRIADDGEILTRGPHVMVGYYNKPEATREAIDQDGWFHTGDIGLVDADGFLKVTDRKKDLIKTAGGKFIAPQPIENMVKSSKFVSNAVMLGDRRKFPIMLVVPNLDNLKAWAVHKRLLAPDDQSLLLLPEVEAKMDREVRKTLRDLAQFEMPKKLLLLASDFSIEHGELTPTLKVRRRIVEGRYKEQIDRLYGEEPQEAG